MVVFLSGSIWDLALMKDFYKTMVINLMTTNGTIWW